LNITAKFQINNDRVSVEIPEKNLSTNKPNVVFFDSQTNGIVDIGESEETIRNNVLEYEKEFPTHLIIGKSFQYDDEKSGFFDLMVVEFYLWSLYYGKKKLPIALEAIDFDFYIPDYEKWTEQRKLRFEYSLMADYKARHLVINNVSKEVPVEKRRIEKTLRLFLTVLLPLVMFYAGLAVTESIQGFIFVFLISFVSIVAGVIVWALISKTLLPKPYLAFILPKIPYASWIQELGRYFLDIQPQK
jgi:hypothetical protein